MKQLILSLSLLAASLVAGVAEDKIEALQADLKFFTDASCQALNPGVKSNDLAAGRSELLPAVAARMLNGTYDRTYRVTAYEAYPSPRELGKTLKLGDGFSRYENITGIYLGPGEHVVLVGNTAGKDLALLIPDWMRKPAEGVSRPKTQTAGACISRRSRSMKA